MSDEIRKTFKDGRSIDEAMAQAVADARALGTEEERMNLMLATTRKLVEEWEPRPPFKYERLWGKGFRIVDRDDNAFALCYDERNAQFIVDRLNARS